MLKSRFRCYEIESCYIALVMARALVPPSRQPWWRVLWQAWRAGKAFARRAGTGCLLIAVAVAAPAVAEAVSAKAFLNATNEGLAGKSLRVYYVKGAVDGLTAAGLTCPGEPKYGEIIAWTDAEIYKAGARNSEAEVLIFIMTALAEHGCRRP